MVRKSDDGLRHGGAWFSAASALPLDRGLTHPRGFLALVTASLQRPQRAVALFRVLLRTKSEHLVVSGSVAGEALRAYFNQRSFGLLPQNRLCRGVLLLGDDHSAYLRGRRRQALRTNLHRAAAAGIVCDTLSEAEVALDAASEVLHSRRAALSDAELRGVRAHWRPLFAGPEITLTVARSPSGRPLAMIAAVIDDTVCLIKVAVASSYDARWALHDHLVRMLIARGASYLVVEGGGPFGALGLTDQEQYYQRLLGYELRHLVPLAPQPLTRRRRRVATGVLAAVTAATLLVPQAAAQVRHVVPRSFTSGRGAASSVHDDLASSVSSRRLGRPRLRP
jgi:hypothetical protein